MSRPTDQWYRELHDRLLAGDPTAPSDLFTMAAPDLANVVGSRYPRHRNTDELHDSVIDALMAYIHRPDAYDSSRAGLRGYLILAARRDLQNTLKKRELRTRLQDLSDDVELQAARRKEAVGEPTLEDLLASGQLVARARVHLPDPADQRVLDLLIDGERRTEAFAHALSIAALPSEEQRVAVKRCKDRIKVLLRRHWREINGEPIE